MLIASILCLNLYSLIESKGTSTAVISPIHSDFQPDEMRIPSIASYVDVEIAPRISSKQYRNSEYSEEHVRDV